jgi:hypothetical protein
MSTKNRFTEGVDSAPAPEVRLSVPFHTPAARDRAGKRIQAEAGEYCRARALPSVARRRLQDEFASLLHHQNAAELISFPAEAP